MTSSITSVWAILKVPNFVNVDKSTILDPLPTSVITQHVYRTPVQSSEDNNDNVGEELKKLADEVVSFYNS